ncbi:MAG TPA: hypothetical protein VIL78_15915 [Hanamia sp.]
MKSKHILLFALVAAFSSCTSAYRTGQTPDDVYYSPVPAQETYVRIDNQQDRDVYGYRNEEQEIRRGIQNPIYRNSITFDLGYGYNPYAYNPYGYSYNPYAYNPFNKGYYDPYGYNYSPYSSYGYNNYGYSSPYYSTYYPPVYVYPGIGNINTNRGPRQVNLGAYNNTNNNNSSNTNSVPVRTFRQANTRQTGVGNVIRRVFSPSNNRTYTPSSGNNRTYNNNNSGNNNYTPARTFSNPPSSTNNSSTNNSSSGSGSSGSAPVRTFRK